MLVSVEYPDLAEKTGGFRRGAPHAVTVGADGARVAFLRSSGMFEPADALWVLNVATAVQRQVSARGVSSFATDHLATVAAMVIDGRLHRADRPAHRVRHPGRLPAGDRRRRYGRAAGRRARRRVVARPRRRQVGRARPG